MKLRTSVTITTNELETLLYSYVTATDLFTPLPMGPGRGSVVSDLGNDVSCQLRFDDNVEGAIIDIYTADPITDHDGRELP